MDITQYIALTDLWCKYNQLITLDIRNGNNIAITTFTVSSNSNLTCVFVDNTSWSTANWTNIGPSFTFVETQAECDAIGGK